jgi:hypothetical protein
MPIDIRKYILIVLLMALPVLAGLLTALGRLNDLGNVADAEAYGLLAVAEVFTVEVIVYWQLRYLVRAAERRKLKFRHETG